MYPNPHQKMPVLYSVAITLGLVITYGLMWPIVRAVLPLWIPLAVIGGWLAVATIWIWVSGHIR